MDDFTPDNINGTEYVNIDPSPKASYLDKTLENPIEVQIEIF